MTGRLLLIATLALIWGSGRAAEFPGGVRDALGPQFTPAPRAAAAKPARRGPLSIDRLRYWNQIAIDASGLDHTPVAPGETRVFGEQIGPGRSSRAMAIVHIAMFDAVNAVSGDSQSYTGLPRARPDTSIDAAIATAAHDTLVALFPSQAAQFDALRDEDLDAIKGGSPHRIAAGVDLGRRSAAAVLALRANDHSQHTEPLWADYTQNAAEGHWRQDPVSHGTLALGWHWGEVTPFALPAVAAFRAPAPPSMTSSEYAVAYEEVRTLGGDSPTTLRTADQTETGIFWAYDGTPSLCAPPRLYNQIALTVADRMPPLRVVELARLLALVNMAMADAGVAIWESKYYYDYWRPVSGIREGGADGNPATAGDPAFTPFGAPASNLNGPNFTPPFPAYPSGHAGFGGALFQTLRRFFGTDAIPFTFVSDELNGVTIDNQGQVRPLKARSFANLSQAEEENGQSRIYLGIHWRFDKTQGIAQGRRVADYVFDHALVPARQ